jgi:hypothetical protein
MRFVCLGYHDENKSAKMSEAERKSMFETCFAYDDELRRGGHFVGGEALQPSQNASTIRGQGGKAVVTDGPYAETKEQIGGILYLEAKDLNHAIQLMSKHPAIHFGSFFEIRPPHEEMNALVEARNERARAAGYMQK